MSFNELTIESALKGLKNKQFSSVELAKNYNERIKKSQSNCFITTTEEVALKQAEQSDKKIASGQGGLLEGVPIAVKDLFCTKGVRTTAASKILGNFIPQYESTVSANLFKSGAVMVGKTNLDEFAMGSANITSAYGNVLSPWKSTKHPKKKLVPGGSSGGSAAAVAEDLALGSLGTDTGGSIRQPAAFCGITGIKPTYGRCSRWGTVAFASSLDQAGVFAKNVKDSALLLQAISGYDEKDSTSVNLEVPNWFANINSNLKGKKIGIPKEYNVDGIPEEIKKIWEKGAEFLKAAGAEIIEVSLPHTKYALPVYYTVAPAECSSNLARYDGVRYGHRTSEKTNSLDEMYEKTRAEGFGDEVKRRIMIGTYVLSAGYYEAYYVKAQKIRTLIAQDFATAFEKVDAILTPTAPSAAFEIGANEDDPVKMYLNDIFTIPASLAGLPGIAVPAGLNDEGLPLGLQIITKPWDEQTCFNVAKAIEDQAGYKLPSF
ncbi:MAG TPA: Asp-tRNA(Asn)/Glu-tRNA(Gln) amidotransferase GatCAB subunit A [Alphaproteobacteria bacterium]|nr:Asp-tRNA(Asn)/Glu-tRNA(Gln) amidotransferase GatCAB subunit A [Alphaproteobacteria bacterium]